MANPSRIFSYRTNSPLIMKLCMEQYVLKLYNVYINDDPELTLTYFTTMSNLGKLVCLLIVGPDIMQTFPCNVNPLTPNFYIVKLGFTGVYIIFLFLL